MPQSSQPPVLPLRAEPDDDYAAVQERELVHLRWVDEQYRAILPVLAVLTERLLAADPGHAIVIDDQSLANSPDLITCRDPKLHLISLTTSR